MHHLLFAHCLVDGYLGYKPYEQKTLIISALIHTYTTGPPSHHMGVVGQYRESAPYVDTSTVNGTKTYPEFDLRRARSWGVSCRKTSGTITSHKLYGILDGASDTPGQQGWIDLASTTLPGVGHPADAGDLFATYVGIQTPFKSIILQVVTAADADVECVMWARG